MLPKKTLLMGKDRGRMVQVHNYDFENMILLYLSMLAAMLPIFLKISL